MGGRPPDVNPLFDKLHARELTALLFVDGRAATKALGSRVGSTPGRV